MGKYLEDKYLNYVLETYFDKYDYNDILNKEYKKLLIEIFNDQKEYINFVQKYNQLNSYSKLFEEPDIYVSNINDFDISIGYCNFMNSAILKNIYNKHKRKDIYYNDKLREEFKNYLIKDFDNEYKNFISAVSKDYSLINSKINNIFRFKLQKISLQLLKIKEIYIKIKRLISTINNNEKVIYRIENMIQVYFSVSYNVIIDKKSIQNIQLLAKEITDKKINKTKSQPKSINPENIKYIYKIYDLFIQWIKHPKYIQGNSLLSMIDIISIYVLLNKPIQDLCDRCKKGKFDKLYNINKRFAEEYDDYFYKEILNNIGNDSKIIERGFDGQDYVYNPNKNKIFYIGYEHGELVSDFTNWDLLFVSKMFQGDIEIKEIKQMLEEYDKEKGYNFI